MSKNYPDEDTRDQQMRAITQQLPDDRLPQTLSIGFVRVEALRQASKEFIARKWSLAAQERISKIMQRDIENHDDKPIRYRINRIERQVVDFAPASVGIIYNIENLKLLDDNKIGGS